MRITTICGSTRIKSSNTALLEAYNVLAEQLGYEVNVLEDLPQLPHFDPEHVDDELPDEVIQFRKNVSYADVIVISTPEYIHSMLAILKNGLEWLVGDPRFVGKRVVILKVHERSRFAHESLVEVLKTMSANLLQDAYVHLEASSSNINSYDILENETWRSMLNASLGKLAIR